MVLKLYILIFGRIKILHSDDAIKYGDLHEAEITQ